MDKSKLIRKLTKKLIIMAIPTPQLRKMIFEMTKSLSVARRRQQELVHEVTHLEGMVLSISNRMGVIPKYPGDYYQINDRISTVSNNLKKMEIALDRRERHEHLEDEHPDFNERWIIGD